MFLESLGLTFREMAQGAPLLSETYLRPYLPVALLATLALVVAGTMLGLSQLLGPHRKSAVKDSTYECGAPLLGGARERFSIKFYVIAILFVLFDIEGAFLIPWAVVYRDLGFAAVLEMLFFVGVLVVGFAYAWKRGGLDWD